MGFFQSKWFVGIVSVLGGAVVTEVVDYTLVYAKARRDSKVLAELAKDPTVKAALEAAAKKLAA